MEFNNGNIDEAFEALLNVDIFALYEDEPQNNDFYAGMLLEELLEFRILTRKIVETSYYSEEGEAEMDEISRKAAEENTSAFTTN